MTANTAESVAGSANPDFDYIRELVRRGSAIVLEPIKEYLVEARLGPLARKEGIGSLRDLVARLRSESDGVLRRKVIEAMTTNETLFFRDVHPFEAMRTSILPELQASRATSKSLRIWCAACSTGQEPYTIAMLLREHLADLDSWRVDILATDLSSEALDRARKGSFGQIEVNRGLPAKLMVKFFTQSGMEWRNVLIYFDSETKKSILARVRRLLRPDGYLFLGAVETTMNLDDGFERVQIGKSGCYRVKPGA